MKSLMKWMDKENLDYKQITLTSQGGTKEAVLVNTDYEGPYPSKEQFRILDMIRTKVNRYYKDKFTVESRGHYTAVLIISKIIKEAAVCG